VTLRQEAVDNSSDGIEAASWGEAVHRWRDYIRDSRETAAVFENQETAARVTGGDPNRFAPEYADKQYAKLKDLERGLRDRWGRMLWTAMLTFTASSTDGDRPAAPVDHLNDLTGSWEAVRRELNRVLDGREWEYLWILEPHESGYLHRHLAVFVKGPVGAEAFRSVFEAHLRNCDRAGAEAHDLDDEGTVSVKHVGADRAEDRIGNLGTYLAEYLGTYGDDPLEAPENQQMANAVVWATGKRRWQPSRGAQEYMATNRGGDEPSPWEFVGIEDGDGEVYAVSGESGGVTRVETWTLDRDSDPPPGRCGGLESL
jgi:hypothetical protein